MSPASAAAEPDHPPRRGAAAVAPSTALRYARDWDDFRTWCGASGDGPLPASPATLSAYLQTLAHLSPGALTRRLAAINGQHRRHGLPRPGADASVRATLRAARRAATPRRTRLPPPAVLRRAARSCPSDLAGLRDRAILLLLAEGVLDRETIVGLKVERIRITPIAIEVAVAWDEAEKNRPVLVRRSDDVRICPVHALRDWLDSAGITFDAVFPKIDRWGNQQARAMGPDAIRRILLRRVKAGHRKAKVPA